MEKDQGKEKRKEKGSALRVQAGIDQPSGINDEAVKKYRKIRKKTRSPEEYFEGICQGNTIILSQAITLVESYLPAHQEFASKLLELCLPHSGHSIRIGITGIPGVGKSTFIETLGLGILEQNHRLAVLAIDPSSERSGGSILGDKTRMEKLSVHPRSFIRPSPSAGSLGGVARKTRETIILCEAAGFDTIFIETVGVGQSETMVHSMVDFFLLLMLAGAGDELQGIKRGIMEMADMIAITKADGNNSERAEMARREYENALHLFPAPTSGWFPRVVTCSAFKPDTVMHIWDQVNEYVSLTRKNGYFDFRRTEQARYWMHEFIREQLNNRFYHHPAIRKKMEELERKVRLKQITSFQAARMLMELFDQVEKKK